MFVRNKSLGAFVALMCAMMALGAAGPAYAENLVVNPGFESGAPKAELLPEGSTYTAASWTVKSDQNVCSFYQETGIGWGGGPVYYSGTSALRVYQYAYDAVVGTAWQELRVAPNAEYTASVWVYTRGEEGQPGFGSYLTDWAGVVAEELDADGVVLHTYDNGFTDGVNSYRQASVPFTTDTETRKVRFILTAAFSCRYNQGHLKFDDCSLEGPAPPAKLAGTVTSGGSFLEGASVEVAAQGKSATSGPGGSYTITDLAGAAGETVRASKSGYYAQRKGRNLVPGETTGCDFDLTAVGSNLLLNAGFDDGWGNAWNGMAAFSVSPESWYAQNYPPGYFFSGEEATFICNWDNGTHGGYDGRIYQIASVKPGTSYTAVGRFHASEVAAYGSVWGNLGDAQVGALYVQEYAADGTPIGSEQRVYGQETKAWETLSLPSTTDANTAYVAVGGYAYMLDRLTWTLARATFDSFELNGPGISLGSLEALPDNAPVSVVGKVVTASFDGFFYVEEADRSSGIKVTGTTAAGDIVRVAGKMETVNGERQITSTFIERSPDGTIPAPLGMNNRSTKEPLPVGLYVTVWGKVTSAETGYFTMTDGSGQNLKVYGSGTLNDYVRVEGPLGAELDGSDVIPVVRAVSVIKKG